MLSSVLHVQQTKRSRRVNRTVGSGTRLYTLINVVIIQVMPLLERQLYIKKYL